MEVGVGPAELAEARRRAERDDLAPCGEEALLRYLVYLGAAYVQAEREAERAGSLQEAYAAVYALYGQAGAATAVLRFHYGEASRLHSARERARAAGEITRAIYVDTAGRLQREIALREERLRNLRAAVADADRPSRR